MYSKLLPLVYLLSFVIITVQTQPCLTPDKTVGECLVITECPAAYNLMQTKTNLSQSISYLRSINCGYLKSHPKVCCTVLKSRNIDTRDLLPSRSICGKEATDRIFGGTLTHIREFPWMALLKYQKLDETEFQCGGFLINNRYVATAAHCLLNTKDWILLNVRLGEHDITKDKDCENEEAGSVDCNSPFDVDIEEQIPHEFYNPHDKDRKNDIALLRLNREVNYSDFIRPLCLPLSQRLRSKNYIGKNLTVTGWGLTEDYSASDVKLKVEVPVVGTSECAPFYKKNGIDLSGSQICAGGIILKDSCKGDSGGPLMAIDRTDEDENYIAYAMVSFGPFPCGLEKVASVYTKLADYVDWIRENLKP